MGLSPGISPPGVGPSPRVSLLGGQPVRGQGGLSTSRGSLQLSARGSTLQLGRPLHRASVQFEGLSGSLSKVAAHCFVAFLCYLIENLFGLTKWSSPRASPAGVPPLQGSPPHLRTQPHQGETKSFGKMKSVLKKDTKSSNKVQQRIFSSGVAVLSCDHSILCSEIKVYIFFTINSN